MAFPAPTPEARPGVRDSGGSSLLGPLWEELIASILSGGPGGWVRRQLVLGGGMVDKLRCPGNARGWVGYSLESPGGQGSLKMGYSQKPHS